MFRVGELPEGQLILLLLSNSYEASNENCIGTSLKCPCFFQVLERNSSIGLSSYSILDIEFPKLLSLN